MWIRTTNGIMFVEVKQTLQGLWIPKSECENEFSR